MTSILWGFPNPNSLQGLCRLLCCIYPYLPQLTNHPAHDEGQRLKMFSGFLMLCEESWGQAWNLFKSLPISGTLLIFGSILGSTLSYISQLSLSSLFPLFSQRDVCWECAHLLYISWHDGVPVVCMHVIAHAYVHKCVRASRSTAACGSSCREAEHDTAVNFKGKLINRSTGDGSTSSAQNGLRSITLGKNCHVLQKERRGNS